MDRRCQVNVADRRWGGFDVGDEVRRVGVAALGQMNLVAGPGGAAFISIARLAIVGRVEARAGRWQISCRAPAHDVVLEIELRTQARRRIWIAGSSRSHGGAI